MRNLAFFIFVIGLGLFPSCAPAGTPATKNLDAVQANIETDFKTVAQLTAKEVLALDPKQTLILDIREPEEYAVSRLPKSALIQIGDVRDKDIIVYCSVGVRSSIFAKRAQNELREMGATSVSNLKHGIFGWHNEQRDLVDATGETDAVHPYNENWGRYVKRREMARYSPALAE